MTKSQHQSHPAPSIKEVNGKLVSYIDNHVSATVIADSINQFGQRITTFQLTFPRIILPEFNTHRKFSRNAASTRAIPAKKSIARVRENPFVPFYVGVNQSGMQSDNLVSDEVKDRFQKEWVELMGIVADYVERWTDSDGMNIHKQIACRALEPWTFSQVVMTTTDLTNFDELRNHTDAEPHIHDLAIVIKDIASRSVPVLRTSVNDWHLPYVSDEERDQFEIADLLAFSTARCARVSYLLHDGTTPNQEKDQGLHDGLVASRPIHASPTEHQAYPNPTGETCKNHDGWVQYRAIIEANMYANV